MARAPQIPNGWGDRWHRQRKLSPVGRNGAVAGPISNRGKLDIDRVIERLCIETRQCKMYTAHMSALTSHPTRHNPTSRRPAGCCVPVERSRLATTTVAVAVARYKALADATRLTVLATLAASPDPVCACDLGEGVDLGQPTISHHLRVLREAGLVTAERHGTWGFYRLAPDAAAWVRAMLASLPR